MTGRSGASFSGPMPMPYCAVDSGWCRSNAGDSERMRGMDVKLWRGGGHEVAHSSDRAVPHGSSTVTLGARRAVIQTFQRNGSIDTARIAAPNVESSFI